MSEQLPEIEGAVIEQAALWHERLARDPQRTRNALDAWLVASPAHAQAFAEVEATLAIARDAADDPGLLALRHQTLARVALRRRPWYGSRAVAAAVALVLAVPTVWLGYPYVATLASGDAEVTSQHYRTAIGNRRTIQLADGSEVTLNTDTALDVAYSARERRLVLQRGQALFKVTKDAARPFTVTSGLRQVTAHGTEFDVRVDADLFRVALLEGSVSVTAPADKQAGRIMLKPNEVLTARGNRIAVDSEDVHALASWREGLLVLHDRDLRSAAAEMNRYDARHIEFADERTARMRISGAFRLGDTKAFAEALTDVLPIETAESTSNRIVLKAR
ncbi:FecR family protein [Novosphingobium sp. JCM 18896]|uniref:FecR family protein n=1 Tax=Novosphingobium sp. JCM 18896 TaxID=2989731 RepID=UPI002222B6F8|nr:FecR domain-containing protein [Novosphingobium sp. JCM 18896]MCW1430764.1 FecR domain-containing protein [Novosphingobium sp. JCM 18896]